jgi:hypothetical protein
MSTVERDDSRVMPDWIGCGVEEIGRIDRQPIVELGKVREFAPRAAPAEDL